MKRLMPLILAGGLLAAPFLASRAGLPPDKETLGSLIEEADLIVLGQVKNLEEPGDGTTWVYLKIEKMFKGSAADRTITLVIPGGKREGSATPLIVADQPKFQMKEKTIVFLQEIGDRYEICRGLSGAYPGKGPDAEFLELNIRRYLKRKPLH